MSAPTTVRSDEDIQRDVLEELSWEAEVQPNEIGVAVNDSIVRSPAGSIRSRRSGRRSGPRSASAASPP